MSYDLYLNDPVSGEVLEVDVPHHMRGGTYRVGGDTELHLNITYNYGEIYRKVIDEEDGIRFLYGKSGAASIPILDKAINRLKNDVSKNYWDATEGNAKRALIQLKAMAEMRPDGVWDGD